MVTPAGSRPRAAWRAVECGLLFGVAPLLYAVQIRRLGPWLIPTLVAIGVFSFWVLWRDPTFDRRRLWRGESIRREWPTVMAVWAFGVVATATLMVAVRPDLLFNLPRRSIGLWVLVVVLYPLLSVYPQELFWRAWFFHRYGPLFGNGLGTVAASAVAFGWMHIVMWNALAIAMSLAGGVLFGIRYWRSESLAATSLEHSLWGQLIFTIGLGAFFYAR